MTEATANNISFPGIEIAEIPILRKQYGYNKLKSEERNRFLHIIWELVREPMFILLVVASSLYFILGSNTEGYMMLVAMLLVSMISLYQETRSSNAIKALERLTEPRVKVVRSGNEVIINSEDLLPGDIMLLEEGMRIPADAEVKSANDLSTDDSIITGESVPVEKYATNNRSVLYQGTTINSGRCVAVVTAIGNQTVLGRIGKSISGYTSSKTKLQQQVGKLVKKLALFGFAGFILILFVNYLNYREWGTSLLFALTLAMSAIPEEIPVAFSSFMALGASKLGRKGVVSRQPQVIENLGTINIICLDKTGTLTENKMQVRSIYNHLTGLLHEAGECDDHDQVLLFYAILSSEEEPFDSMEKAIIETGLRQNIKRGPDMMMIHEYPLAGQPPMMTHVYKSKDTIWVAAKGGAEKIIEVCRLSKEDELSARDKANQLGSQGYRVLGVARANHNVKDFPAMQEDYHWEFLGLLALYDPPRKDAKDVLKQLTDAGIAVKLVTGDHPETARNIARETGIENPLRAYLGNEIMKMGEGELENAAIQCNVFARMYPDAKSKLIGILKKTGNTVAMTGDGVNDGPALKAADIGIAMGKKGTETARKAADLVLLNDDLKNIVVAVNDGRKIYSNLVKAIRYIMSIHIPIILVAALPVILGWTYPNIFSPVHVIFLELIMAPTCSIFYEMEPMEKDLMKAGPRSRSAGLFNFEEWTITIIQGLAITIGVLSLFYAFMIQGASIDHTRTIVFTTLLISNAFLTFTNRSFTRSITKTITYRNKLAPIVAIISVLFIVLLHTVKPLQVLFKLQTITWKEFVLCLLVSLLTVGWFEIYKLIRSDRTQTHLLKEQA